MGLIVDQMAAKEMYIGRYYMKTEKWIAAINRFQAVVKHYDMTILSKYKALIFSFSINYSNKDLNFFLIKESFFFLEIFSVL